MDIESKVELSEALSNLVENVAVTVAKDNAGRVTPAHLIPYLPMSLRTIEKALDGMVNDQSVFADHRDGFKQYSFTAYEKEQERRSKHTFEACASCGKDFDGESSALLCLACSCTIREELGALATKNAWPANAVYEHEILFLASRIDKPVPAETLAAETRFTLRSMKAKLKRLVVEGFARQDIDEEEALEKFTFEKMEYPKERYRANMEVIRSYPASLMEEIELKTVRIVLALTLMLACCFVLAVMRVPYPILVPGFLVSAPVASLVIWKKKIKPAQT